MADLLGGRGEWRRVRIAMTVMLCVFTLLSSNCAAWTAESPGENQGGSPVASPRTAGCTKGAAPKGHVCKAGKASAPAATAKPPVSDRPFEDPLVWSLIKSLREAGQYGEISGIIDTLNGSFIRPGLTLFAPNDNSLSGVRLSTHAATALLSFHVVTRQLSFSDLSQLNVGTRLPTPLANISVVVTSNSAGEFRVDNAAIITPDLYNDKNIAVHGVDSIFNASAYNMVTVSMAPSAHSPTALEISPVPVLNSPSPLQQASPPGPGAAPPGPAPGPTPHFSGSLATGSMSNLSFVIMVVQAIAISMVLIFAL